MLQKTQYGDVLTGCLIAEMMTELKKTSEFNQRRQEITKFNQVRVLLV